MKKTLNLALLISFIITIMVPLTGIHIHKMASAIFLLLSLIHTIVYRQQLGVKRWFMLLLIVISFATGLLASPLIDEIMTQNAALEELLDTLQEIDPDGRRIGELLLEGKTKYDISIIFNSKTSTFYKRFDRLKMKLREYLDKKF